MINKIYDDDGLVSTSLFRISNSQIKINGKDFFIDVMAMGVAEYLSEIPTLWELAKFRIQNFRPCMGRASIYGVPFEIGLRRVSKKDGLIKSLYQRDDSDYVGNHGIVGSLLAHTTYSERCITFEAWQILEIDGSETFYIHCEIDLLNNIVTHIDGARMYHSLDQKLEMIYSGTKIKGDGYTKYFRLDGQIPLKNAREIMTIYLPLDDITEEFISENNLEGKVKLKTKIVKTREWE